MAVNLSLVPMLHARCGFFNCRNKLGGAEAECARVAHSEAARLKRSQARIDERDLVVFAKQKEIYPNFTPHRKMPATIDGREYFMCANTGCKMRTLLSCSEF